jgi:hypothetical protein
MTRRYKTCGLALSTPSPKYVEKFLKCEKYYEKKCCGVNYGMETLR